MQKILILAVLLLVFFSSAYMSLYGLAAMFASAGIVVICMGAGMEAGKIMAIIHLHRKWSALRWLARGFYILVIAALVICTSAEILGYLSQNHVKGFLELKQNRAALNALDKEEEILKSRIEIIDSTLAGLPISYVSKRLRERENAGYSKMQSRLTEIAKEKADLEKMQIKDKSYAAPIFATARIFGIDPNRAASIFIFFIICILEPLLILLTLATSSVWLPKSQDKIKSIDPVAKAILRLINKKGDFIGTVTELLNALNSINQTALCNSSGNLLSALILGRKLQSKPLQKEFIKRGIFMAKTKNKIEISSVEYPV